jgi:hypothetical protein
MTHRLAAAILSALTILASAAAAQEAAAPRLAVELNRIDQIEGACRLTFMVENAMGADLDALALETVLFDADGLVERLTLFEFGALPSGVPRVRQFDVPGLACDGLARVLINGVAECPGGLPCAAALAPSSRTDVEVIG